VALLTALALTAFSIGCIEPLAESGDTGTYREVEIKEFNAWGGNALFQSGWGTDGAKWDSGKKEVKSIGLSIEDLQAAKYLVVEVNDGFPKNNFETIWDGWDADGNKTGDWAQFSQVTSAAGDLNPGMGTRDGNILKLEMAKIIKDYSLFRSKSTVAITLLIQHWGNGGTAACIKSAKLLVSDEPVPFVPVRNMSLVTNSFYWTNELSLDAKFTSDDATNQRITWAIMQWRSADGATTLRLPVLDPSDPDSIDAYEEAQGKLFGKVSWKQEEYIVDDSVYPNKTALRPIIGTLVAPGGIDSVGTVTLYAIVKEGTLEDTSKPEGETNKIINFEKDLMVTIRNPPPFTFKLDGVERTTVQYGAVDNGGVSGGTMELLPANEEGKRTGYTITYAPSGGQYGNSYHFFVVDFGVGGNIGQYKGLTCHVKATGNVGDSHLVGKSYRVKAMTARPHRTYNPGPFIATVSTTDAEYDGFEYLDGEGNPQVTKKEADLDFVFFEDNSIADNKQGIFDQGVGKDLSTVTADSNAARFTNYPETTSAPLKTSRYLWVWILPWDAEGRSYEISDIDFYK
jgi:hypothetical protein